MGRLGARSTYCRIVGVGAVAWALACGQASITPPVSDVPAPIALERQLPEGGATHRPRMEDGVPRLGDARFTRGMTLGALRVALRAIGRAGTMLAVASSEPTIDGRSVRIRRGGGVVEWWRAVGSGLEQGVTIDTRPDGEGDLVLEMSVGDDITPSSTSEDEIVLSDRTGLTLATYSHLGVVDAAGERVAARMLAVDGRIRISVADAGARYPLVVDPLVHAVEVFTATSPAGAPTVLGFSVAVTSDGSRLVAGAPGATTTHPNGFVAVYRQSGGTWVEEAQLTPPDAVSGDTFGLAVAISDDGTAAVVGADAAGATRSDEGRVYVFRRTDMAWSHEASLDSPLPSPRYFGRSLDIAGDGSRIAVGGLADPTGGGEEGAAVVFVRAASTWSFEASLQPCVGYIQDSVALSVDGSRVLCSADPALSGDRRVVRAYVFARAATTWTLEATLDGRDDGSDGTFVWLGANPAALAADGSLAVFGSGAIEDSPPSRRVGVVHTFARVGTAWLPMGLPLHAPAPGVELGRVTAISPDGNRLAVASERSELERIGRVWILDRTGDEWVPAATIDPGVLGGEEYAGAMALDGSGDLAVVGDPTEPGAAGALGAVHLYELRASASPGARCASPAECLSGFCVDGLCCDLACDQPCAACAASLTDGSDGTCAAARGGTVCRPAEAMEECDAPEACDGTTLECPLDVVRPTGFPCRPPIDACDALEICDGTSPLCAADVLLAGVECRTSVGGCDIAEVCSGSSAGCPPDGVLSAGVACRVATDPACDPAEVCDGVAAGCPADLTTCTRDAGDADGGMPDAATGPPRAVTGCGCHVAGAGPLTPLTLLGVGAAVLLTARARSRRTRARTD